MVKQRIGVLGRVCLADAIQIPDGIADIGEVGAAIRIELILKKNAGQLCAQIVQQFEFLPQGGFGIPAFRHVGEDDMAGLACFIGGGIHAEMERGWMAHGPELKLAAMISFFR